MSPLFIDILNEFTETMSDDAKEAILFALSLAFNDNHQAMILPILNTNILQVLCKVLLAFDANSCWAETFLVVIRKILSLSKDKKFNDNFTNREVELFVGFGGYKSLLALRKDINVKIAEGYMDVMDLCLNHFYKKLKDIHRKIKKCKYCNNKKKEYKLFLCKGCLNAKYCSTKCQKRHWSQHKTECYLLQ